MDLIGDEGADQDHVSMFWKEILGEEMHKAENDEFVLGFMKGAIQFWDEVAHLM